VRRIQSHPAAKDNAGRLAVERGPLVYCAEAVDNGGHALNLVLPDDTLFTEDRVDVHGHGLVSLKAPAQALFPAPDGAHSVEPVTATLIPYFAWCHRGDGEMQVWFPADLEHGEPAVSRIASPK
ncbi:MAG: hypothetical protein LBV54_05725, partial [Puniceicoccales bacterium]|jgi:DUF1680 family protein|nr:hypothetical protein [Puniceicoccales bacterium]